MFIGGFSNATQVPSGLAPTLAGAGQQPLGLYQSGRARPAAPAITGSLGIAPPPPTRPLSAPQSFVQAPMPAMAPSFTGNPNAGMTYNSVAPPAPQQTPPTIMGGVVSGGMPSQILYQPTGFGTAGFPPGYQIPQIQRQMTGLPPQQRQQQQQALPFPAFSSAPGIGSLGVNRVLPPPLIPQPTAASLQPQPTGPAPAVRFGVPQKKLTPQPTGRANLNKASTWALLHFVWVWIDN